MIFRGSVRMAALLLLLGGTRMALAQRLGVPKQPSAAELLRAVERLSVVGNVLYVAAHPDDENTRLLGYISGEKLLRTAYLSVTRGDGGQNLIGAEQGPLLGLIRTEELLAARSVDGAEQFFTRARDFGYSKTATETLSIWNKDAVLSDVVRVIRQFHPDIVITRFSTQGGDTHGHHTASAILAGEAVRAAADASAYPDTEKSFGTWQVKRLYWNRSLWGGQASSELSSLPKLDIGGYNPVLGISYGEMAADSRSMHKSQGFGVPRSRGPNLEYFAPLAGAAPGQNVFDGLDFSWARVPGSERLVQLLAQAKKEFDPHHPEAIFTTLLQARTALEKLPENPWKAQKLVEMAEVIAACAGLFAEATANQPAIVSGGKLQVSLSAINRSQAPLKLREVRILGAAATSVPVNTGLAVHEPWQKETAVAVPAVSTPSGPYWLNVPPESGIYVVPDPSLIGMPRNPPPLSAEFIFIAGQAQDVVTLRRPVLFKWTDPVAGERYRSIEITPPVMVNPEAQILMFPDGQGRPLRVRLKSGTDEVIGTLHLELPAGFSAEPTAIPFTLKKYGEEAELRFTVKPPAGNQSVNGSLRVVAEVGGQKYSRGTLHIDYPHIPIQALFPESEVKLARFEMKKTRTKIGYIAGAGDDVAASLRQVGFDVTELREEALLHGALGVYGAIVVGVRAYNTNPRMQFYYQRLMDYVAGGGNLIVQYNTNNRLSKLGGPLGPHPFEISQDRVTDEKAAVSFLLKDHPLLARPNRITDADFAGWVQERGLYFADKWDEKYQTPLGMNDPQESQKRGSLLLTKHGKGAFIYTGLAFFRQLPAGVPGAYRLFANMISYGQ